MANVYAYDYHGHWDQTTNHHSAVEQSKGTYHAKYIMDYYTKNGFDKSQLNLGIPFYGQSYTLESKNNGMGASVSGSGVPGKYSEQPGMLTFFEIYKAELLIFFWCKLDLKKFPIFELNFGPIS